MVDLLADDSAPLQAPTLTELEAARISPEPLSLDLGHPSGDDCRVRPSIQSGPVLGEPLVAVLELARGRLHPGVIGVGLTAEFELMGDDSLELSGVTFDFTGLVDALVPKLAAKLASNPTLQNQLVQAMMPAIRAQMATIARSTGGSGRTTPR